MCGNQNKWVISNLLILTVFSLSSCGGGGTPVSQGSGTNGDSLSANYTIELEKGASLPQATDLAVTRYSVADVGEDVLAHFGVLVPEGVDLPSVARISFQGDAPTLDQNETVEVLRRTSELWEIEGYAQKTENGFRFVMVEAGEYLLRKVTQDGAEFTSFVVFASSDRINGDAPLAVNFTARPLNAVGAVSYDWDFGDGGTSIEQNPSHTYANPGSYVVHLIAMDSAENQFFAFSTPIEVFGVAGLSISGIVRNAVTSSPVAGALVSLVSADGHVTSVSTGMDGSYAFSDLSTGMYTLLFAGEGFTSANQVVEVATEPLSVDRSLMPSEFIPTSAPNFLFDTPPFTLDSVNGIATVDASVENYAGDTVVRILNGNPITVPFILEQPALGRFVDRLILTAGTNSIRYVVANSLGATVSDEIIIDWQPQPGERIPFRATLTWDRGTSDSPHDMDLHVVDPNGDESYFGRLEIPSGRLDIDNREGFGPENFTAIIPSGQSPIAGTYHVFVVYFRGTDPVACTITLLLNPGTPNEEVVSFGSQVITEADPIWYAVDVTVDTSGLATYSAPGTPPEQTIPNMVGTWEGTWTSNNGVDSGTFIATITQQISNSFSGSITLTGAPGFTEGEISGVVDAAGIIQFGALDAGGQQIVGFSGVVSGDSMGGTYSTVTGDTGNWSGTRTSPPA